MTPVFAGIFILEDMMECFYTGGAKLLEARKSSKYLINMSTWGKPGLVIMPVLLLHCGCRGINFQTKMFRGQVLKFRLGCVLSSVRMKRTHTCSRAFMAHTL